MAYEETGRQFEQQWLLSKNAQKELSRSPVTHEQIYQSHQEIRAAFEEVINRNPHFSDSSESYDPDNRWLNDLHFQIATELGLEDVSRLRVYPALGTSADVHHGVDVIFVYEDPKTDKMALVTADLTKNPEKVYSGMSADLLIGDQGAISNPKYHRIQASENIRGFSVPDLKGASKTKEKQIAKERQRQLSELIARLLRYKTNHRDPVYHQLATRLRLQRVLGQELLN